MHLRFARVLPVVSVGALLSVVAIDGQAVITPPSNSYTTAQGTQFGRGTAFLRFSRDFERQADLLGSHIMADAGYDPQGMAGMFKTIEQQGGPGAPVPGARLETGGRLTRTYDSQETRP